LQRFFTDRRRPCSYIDKVVNDNAASHRAQAAAVADRLERVEEMLERLLPLVGMVQALASSLSSVKGEEVRNGPTYAPSSESAGGPPRQHIHELAGYQMIMRPGQDGNLPVFADLPHRPLPQSAMPQSAMMPEGSPLDRSGQWSSIPPMRSVTQPITMREGTQQSVPPYHTGLSGKIVCFV
jgi:hypothetical protein